MSTRQIIPLNGYNSIIWFQILSRGFQILSPCPWLTARLQIRHIYEVSKCQVWRLTHQRVAIVPGA